MSVREIRNDAHFYQEMQDSGARMVVVDFTASWCGPCQRIAPVFAQLPQQFPKAWFLKVDVDVCRGVASSEGVTAMPTFIIYKNRDRVDRIQGADPNTLLEKIKSHYPSEDDSAEVSRYTNLNSLINRQRCECLNENDWRTLQDALEVNEKYLESDIDEQLLMSISFNQNVKIHSLKIAAPQENGPKKVKLFVNLPSTLDFDQAEKCKPVQELMLTPNDLTGTPINLQYVKFQNVFNIQMFVVNNQNDSEVTRIDNVTFFGSTGYSTNMVEFKRVAGKKGESH